MTIARRCLAAAAAVPVDAGPAEAARGLAASAVGLLGVAWCRIIAEDGTVEGTAAAPGGSIPADRGPLADAATAPVGARRRLEVGTEGVAWGDGDQAALELMAGLAGFVLAEAEAIGRAGRVERRNGLQREFLRGVGHNLRAPLATIALAASDLDEVVEDPFVRARAQAILAEGRRLGRLVDQLLVLSRLETGPLDLDGEPLALPPLVRRVAAELQVMGRVEVVDRADGMVAVADPAATEQIVWILLDNAARYAPAGRIRVEVLAAGDAREPVLTLAVEDEGPGVPAGERRRIFARFARGSAGEARGGTGLGLSVARGLARSLGGDVTCRSGAVGARFEVRLPAAGGAVGGAEEPPRGAPEDGPVEGVDGVGARVPDHRSA